MTKNVLLTRLLRRRALLAANIERADDPGVRGMLEELLAEVEARLREARGGFTPTLEDYRRERANAALAGATLDRGLLVAVATSGRRSAAPGRTVRRRRARRRTGRSKRSSRGDDAGPGEPGEPIRRAAS